MDFKVCTVVVYHAQHGLVVVDIALVPRKGDAVLHLGECCYWIASLIIRY